MSGVAGGRRRGMRGSERSWVSVLDLFGLEEEGLLGHVIRRHKSSG